MFSPGHYQGCQIFEMGCGQNCSWLTAKFGQPSKLSKKVKFRPIMCSDSVVWGGFVSENDFYTFVFEMLHQVLLFFAIFYLANLRFSMRASTIQKWLFPMFIHNFSSYSQNSANFCFVGQIIFCWPRFLKNEQNREIWPSDQPKGNPGSLPGWVITGKHPLP